MVSYDWDSVFPNPPVARDALQHELTLKPWQTTAPGVSTLLVNCRVIDTVQGAVLDYLHNVLIENGQVSSITPSDSSTSQTATTTIDLQGKYLCPGLIDGHVHITAVPGTNTVVDMARLPDQTVTLRATYILRRMLQRGFTTIRDCGGATKILAEALDEGLIEGPRLFQCGKAISQTGGHGDFVTPGLSGGSNPACCGGHAVSLGRTADGVPAVLKAVREELKQGADFIKVMLGGGVASEADGIETVQFSPEEVQAITSTAWQMGKKMVTAHAYTVEAIKHAIDNGCSGIEHGNLMDQETAERMAAKNIWYTPTLSCYGTMMRKPFENSLSEGGQVKSIEVMQQGMEALKMAHEAGVNICYGSDLLISMHAFQTEEFSVRAKALPAADILKHATINPAKMLRREGKLGVIAPGAIADLIVLGANPLEDITVLDRPEIHLKAVFQGGRLVSGGL